MVSPIEKEKSSSKGKGGEGGGQSTFIYVSHSKLHRKSDI